MGTVYELYADGACRGNGTLNSVAGAGAYICKSSGEGMSTQLTRYLGRGLTNNIAEYESLKLGLSVLIEMNVKKVNIYMDSNLVCNQVNGIFRTNNARLDKLRRDVIELLERIDEWTLRYIPREKNKIADQLANEAIDAAGAKCVPEKRPAKEFVVHADGEEVHFDTLDASKIYMMTVISDNISSIQNMTREYKIVHKGKTIFERLVSW